jgi:protein-tyrosine phosphatase
MDKKEPKGRNDGHIFDYSKIEDQIYIGSDLCKGGVCPIHGNEFKELEVFVEINLSAERNEKPPEFIKSYTWLPVVDGYSPDQLQLDIGTSIMNAAIEQGEVVYTHCKNGHGRSPTLVAAYYIRYKGKSVDEVSAFLKEKRPEIHIEEEQFKELRIFQERWQS